MTANDIHCIVPPSPKLEEKIIKSKQMFQSGEKLPQKLTDDLLDLRSLTLIISRPPRTRAHTFTSPTREFAPVTGSRKAVVLLVDFSDDPQNTNKSHYSDMLFSVGTYANGSMRDFYREASYNQFDLIGDVFGWYRAPQPKSFYTNGNYGFGSYPQNAQKLVEDVIALANPDVNFANYDNDGDGFVEALVIIAAGTGGEESGNTGDLWSHKWNISTASVDGVKINSYFMAPEDGKVGVFSHELGHLVLGLPDLYDTDYSSRGTGRWDLMAGGSWNGGGDRPAHPTAWCKAKVGWVSPTVIFNAQQNVTVQPYSSNPQVYKLPIGDANSKEYFLISNRQKAGFDDNLPGEGLVIEHVDDNQTNNTDENHYLVDIEQCDGQSHLNKNANSGDSNDPFPCSTNSAFNAGTTPNSKGYDGSDSKIKVENIQRSGDNVTAEITVGEVTGWLYNKQVTMTFAHHTSRWAWAYIQDLGWRRIKDGAPDGVTNIFDACCEAVANGRKVHVYADSEFIYTLYLV